MIHGVYVISHTIVQDNAVHLRELASPATLSLDLSHGNTVDSMRKHFQSICAVSYCGIETNRFKGALPETGLQSMWVVQTFGVAQNGFEGALPATGLQAMRVVALFCIFKNRFEGALPEIGLQSMRAM
eukprot:5938167-Amphidinium_carterae.1